MSYDRKFLESFVEQFGSTQPPASSREQTVSKQLLVATVLPQIDRWRRAGHSLEAIATHFTALGVTMPVATLRTCLRRSQQPSPTPPRPTRSQRGRRPARKPSGAKANSVHPSHLSVPPPAEPSPLTIELRPPAVGATLPVSPSETHTFAPVDSGAKPLRAPAVLKNAGGREEVPPLNGSSIAPSPGPTLVHRNSMIAPADASVKEHASSGSPSTMASLEPEPDRLPAARRVTTVATREDSERTTEVQREPVAPDDSAKSTPRITLDEIRASAGTRRRTGFAVPRDEEL